MKYVVIGGNAAGLSFAAKMKRNSPNDEIVVLEKRDYVAFGGCGLPYYAGGHFDQEEKLFARKVSDIIDIGIDLKINSIVTDVNKKEKKVIYINNNEEKEITYDRLVVSSGANPIVPDFGNYSDEKVLTLTTKEDGNKLKQLLKDEKNKKVAIIGGGFIGLEVMDICVELNKEVTLIEREDQIMKKQFTLETIDIINKEINSKDNIELLTNTSVLEIKDGYKVVTDKKEIDVDIVVLAIGFSPNTKFIDLEKIPNGAILTDKYAMVEEDIYAIGDCATIYDVLLEEMTYLPLATSANKQGRMLADYLVGNEIYFKGMLKTSGLKFLGYELGRTGLSESELEQNNIKYKSIMITDKNQTHYYEGQENIYVKFLYDADTKVLLGCEIVGKKGVIGRVNAMAVAILNKMTTSEIGYIDFCYAPPFSRTWDALNVVGNVAK